MKPMSAKPIAVAMAIFWNSFLSGFVHLLTNLTESLLNCLRGSRAVTIWSMVKDLLLLVLVSGSNYPWRVVMTATTKLTVSVLPAQSLHVTGLCLAVPEVELEAGLKMRLRN